MNELLRLILFLPPQASAISRSVDHLHYFVIGVTMLVSTVVGAIAWYFIVRFRRKGRGHATVRIEASTAFEVASIGIVLGAFLTWWVIGYRQFIEMQSPPPDAMEVYVTGKQWMWKFSYPEGASSVERLTVPAGRPVRLIMTSRDVIHSFYVPALRLKQDVIPGRYVTTWFVADRVGAYPIRCAEYCGVSHSRMLGEVEVLSQDDYERWLQGSESQPVATRHVPASDDEPGSANLAVIGRSVAVRRACLGCHTIDGQRHVGPTWRGLYKSVVPLSDGRTVIADEAYLTRSMMDPAVEVVAGFRPAMPSYRGVLTEPETAALVEFIKSLAGEGVAPSVVLPPTEARSTP